MARHYATRDFFRQMPNPLLSRYFHARGVFADLDIAALPEPQPEELWAAWLTLDDAGLRNPAGACRKNTPLVSITGATLSSVQAHTEDGLDHACIFFLTPNGDDQVTFTLVPHAACDSGGIRTAERTQLTEVPSARTIPAPEDTDPSDPSKLSVSNSEATEGDDSTIDFIVKLDPASDETVTVDSRPTTGRRQPARTTPRRTARLP